MHRLFCSIAFLLVLCVVRSAHCQHCPGALFAACSRWAMANVPGWEQSSRMQNGASLPLLQQVWGDANNGVCRGYMSVGPRGQRRDVFVFELRCINGQCAPN